MLTYRLRARPQAGLLSSHSHTRYFLTPSHSFSIFIITLRSPLNSPRGCLFSNLQTDLPTRRGSSSRRQWITSCYCARRSPGVAGYRPVYQVDPAYNVSRSRYLVFTSWSRVEERVVTRECSDKTRLVVLQHARTRAKGTRSWVPTHRVCFDARRTTPLRPDWRD